VRAGRAGGQSGFTLIEIVIVMAIAITMAAITVPRISDLLASQRARNAARDVERELQVARLKAVTSAHAMRVRFNCPVAGQLRRLEVTGVPTTDNAANRCDPVAYPFPGPNDMLQSTPSFDSPVIYLPTGTAVATAFPQYEFGANGMVYSVDATGTVAALAADATVTVTLNGWSNGITINGFGRIKFN
jgi:prepilin-type N-terminal cleavage/methylation domain-containing protein